ncbi:MAG: hypothetical protein ACHREM_12630 [Polyangiales bacterium]
MKPTKTEKKTTMTTVTEAKTDQPTALDAAIASLATATNAATDLRDQRTRAEAVEAEARKSAVETDSPTDWQAHQETKTRAERCRLRSEAADALVEKIRASVAELQRASDEGQFADVQHRTSVAALDVAIASAVEARVSDLKQEQDARQRLETIAIAVAVAQQQAVDDLHALGSRLGKERREIEALRVTKFAPLAILNRIDELARAKVAAMAATDAKAAE